MSTDAPPSARDGHRIAAVHVTPVAFRDPPLLNCVGVHEPYALRSIVEVVTDSGLYGLGETYGDATHLARLTNAAPLLVGVDIFNLAELMARVTTSLSADTNAGGDGTGGMVTTTRTPERVFAAFEVAALDLQGKAIGRPVSDLLGGAVRSTVEYSAYLFYKWAGHPGYEEDRWGEALDPAGLVRQAQKMIDEYGFRAIKLKGGVFPPAEEVAAIKALSEAFPGHPLRLDPNAAWTVETSIKVGEELAGIVEYLEDPTKGIDGMSAVAQRVPMPLATNMCVVSFDDLEPAMRQRAVSVVLSDHHFWGGLRRSQLLAGVCDTFGLSLSMHSNSHLGISLAAMTQLAAATSNIDYACDTHWPWKDPSEDVIKPGVLEFRDGAVAVPTGPGLGVELDRDALARLHEQYLTCGIRARDDTTYMRTVEPDFEVKDRYW